ncbi:hypothetical protein [Pseudarthrobacter sp. LT1]|uniref:hypothetical protein n=1 Tax=Pseudarthrobacter sp. LT1 TaxID=3111450 RepID=UPI002D79BF62|nr:hypothetical protein [Pseudarthrobacter sp. LT1]WRT16145.1 hypothetical protein VIK36_21910 [Pseudarthrobacter sp. LT1]
MEEARRTALNLLRNRTLTPDDLYIAFYAVGGTAGPLELEAYIYGLLPVSVTDAELLFHALQKLQEI